MQNAVFERQILPQAATVGTSCAKRGRVDIDCI